jgi:hypothetical protein
MEEIPSRQIPTADELQIQFITWLLGHPELPLLVSPASSGFYNEVWGLLPGGKTVAQQNDRQVRSKADDLNSSIDEQHTDMEGSFETPYDPTSAKINLPINDQHTDMEGSFATPYDPTSATKPSTGFFDEDYVGGKRQIFVPEIHKRPGYVAKHVLPINPACRPEMTYEEACYTATLTTTSDIEQHEARLYQPGYTLPLFVQTYKICCETLSLNNILLIFKPKTFLPAIETPELTTS